MYAVNTAPASDALLHWRPSRQSGLALLTEVGMLVAYAVLGRSSSNLAVAALIGLVVVPILAVAIPVYWTLVVERQPLAALGLTRRYWGLALALSLGLSLLVLGPLWLSGPPAVAPTRWLPMAVAGALALFEPLFVFGWLQGRFERDFGALPAILLAALGYALYHVGYLPGQMSGQFYSAVVFAVCFRLTQNLAVAWPALWAANSAWLCLGANACFYTWDMATAQGVALALELAFIALCVVIQRRRTAQPGGTSQRLAPV